LQQPKVVAVVLTLDESPMDTIRSILQQTIKVSKILVVTGSYRLFKLLSRQESDIVKFLYLKPNMNEPLGVRVSKAINFALEHVNIEDYDYLLRVDADIILPKRFIEENLKAEADYVGKAGYCMLIKVSPFLKVFGGRFKEVGAEDSYVGMKFMYHGYQVKGYILSPILTDRAHRKHSYRYHLTLGMESYKLGYEPIHVFEKLRYGKMEPFRFLDISPRQFSLYSKELNVIISLGGFAKFK